MRSRAVWVRLVVCATPVVGFATGCTSAQHAPAPSPTPRLGAAEPAKAPTGTATPAGQVGPLDPSPEGLVYDATTNTLAVAVQNPARLLLIDPTTFAVRTTVALPGTVRHLQLAAPGGPVIVPCESSNSVLEVALGTGAILSSTAVGKQPHDASALSDGRVVVGNEFGKSLSIVADGKVQRTASGVEQPGGVIGAGTEVAIVDVHEFTVSTFNPDTGARTAILPAGAGPTHGVLTGKRVVVVTDTRGNQLLTFGLDPLTAIGKVSLPGNPYGIAVDDSTNTVWVTLTAVNEVVGFDVSAATPREIARYPTVDQPNSVAVDPGSHTVWVVGHRLGDIQRITR